MLIKEKWVEDSAEYLVDMDSIDDAAACSGQVVLAEFNVKKVKADLMLNHCEFESPQWKVEAWALTHPDYKKAQEELAEARAAVTKHFRLKERSSSIIAAWQTQSSNFREAGKVR